MEIRKKNPPLCKYGGSVRRKIMSYHKHQSELIHRKGGYVLLINIKFLSGMHKLNLFLYASARYCLITDNGIKGFQHLPVAGNHSVFIYYGILLYHDCTIDSTVRSNGQFSPAQQQCLI